MALVERVERCLAEYAEFAPAGWELASEGGAAERLELALAKPTTQGLVAEAGSGQAGHVLWIPSAGSERLSTSDPDVAYLWQLFVEPSHRGTGVAARLLAAAVSAIACEGYGEARLLTPRDHRRARRFYAREGWSLLGDWGVDPELGLALVECGLRVGHNEAR